METEPAWPRWHRWPLPFCIGGGLEMGHGASVRLAQPARHHTVTRRQPLTARRCRYHGGRRGGRRSDQPSVGSHTGSKGRGTAAVQRRMPGVVGTNRPRGRRAVELESAAAVAPQPTAKRSTSITPLLSPPPLSLHLSLVPAALGAADRASTSPKRRNTTRPCCADDGGALQSSVSATSSPSASARRSRVTQTLSEAGRLISMTVDRGRHAGGGGDRQGGGGG